MDLKTAVERWIRADWFFRWGPYAFSERAQDIIVQAERELREAATGHQELSGAAQALGVDLPEGQTLAHFQEMCAAASMEDCHERRLAIMREYAELDTSRPDKPSRRRVQATPEKSADPVLPDGPRKKPKREKDPKPKGGVKRKRPSTGGIFG